MGIVLRPSFDKKEGRGLRGVRWANLSGGEVFIKRVFSGFSFLQGERIHLSNLWSERVIKIDLVIIGSRGGNVVSGFLGEYGGKG